MQGAESSKEGMLGREHFQNVHPDHYSFLLNFAITLLLVSVNKLVKHLVKNVNFQERNGLRLLS